MQSVKGKIDSGYLDMSESVIDNISTPIGRNMWNIFGRDNFLRRDVIKTSVARSVT